MQLLIGIVPIFCRPFNIIFRIFIASGAQETSILVSSDEAEFAIWLIVRKNMRSDEVLDPLSALNGFLFKTLLWKIHGSKLHENQPVLTEKEKGAF